MPGALDDLELQLQGIEQAEANVARSRTNRMLQPSDVPLLMEGLLLRLHTSLESFLQASFFEFLTMPGPLFDVNSALAGASMDRCVSVVYAEGSRLDWLPYDRTADRAGAYLRGRNPFHRLAYRDQTKELLGTLHVVRNRVGHPGEEAERAYIRRVSKGEQSHAVPGSWLADTTLAGGRTNLDVLLQTCRSTARAIAQPSPALDALLPPMSRVTGEQLAIPGPYVCAGPGGHRYVIGSRQKLGGCGVCNADTWTFVPL